MAAAVEKDRLELVYNIARENFRLEWRSNLLPERNLTAVKRGFLQGSPLPSNTSSQIGKESKKLRKQPTVSFLSRPKQALLRKPKTTGNLYSEYTANSRRDVSPVRSRLLGQAQGQNDHQILELDPRNPPLLIDGRRFIIPIPRLTRTLEIYWRRGLDKRSLRTHGFGSQNDPITPPSPNKPRGETEVLVRKVKLPAKVFFERNVRGRWEECYVERL